jgi:hypothetical protein
MAYYSGQANSLQDLLNSFINTCVAEGWTWGADAVLSKDKVGVKLQILNNHITALAGQGAGLINPAPTVVRLGALDGQAINFPCDYYFFIFDNPAEVFCVLKCNVDKFLWLCFGQSTLVLPGSGVWISASKAFTASTAISIGVNEGGVGYTGSPTPAAPFWNTEVCYNSFLHHGLETQWNPNSGAAKSTVGSVIANSHMGTLIFRQPSSWNGEAVLFPIIPMVLRLNSKKNHVAEIKNARFLRIDNYEAGQIITYGTDKWKVFPFYKKDILNRDGGGYRDSSGTFGWAIRYDGP